MEGTRETSFSRWLRDRLDSEQKTVRGLARDIAENSPGGASVKNTESVRRALNKYLREGRMPSKPMRKAIAGALGVDESEMPEDGADEAVTRELVALKLDEMIERTSHDLRNLRRFRRALVEGVV